MPLDRNNAKSLPYELNNRAESSLDARKIGVNKRASGIAVANEILFNTYENMSFPQEGPRMNGMVIAEPMLISKSDMVNFFSNANYPLADKDSSNVEEFRKRICASVSQVTSSKLWLSGIFLWVKRATLKEVWPIR